MIQPIIVRKYNRGYQIVAGERRYRASKLAGLKTVPCVIKDIDDKQVDTLAIIENIQRENLSPIEEANAYKTLIDIINKTIENGGNVVIPSFSVGRTQEIIYILNRYVENGHLKAKVYIDSPLAKEATKVFNEFKEYYDKDAKELLLQGDNPLDFKNLIFTDSADESKKIKEEKGAIIISSSGMCEGGRVKYHLLNNLDDENSAIVFVGYQAKGTLGSQILNGHKEIRIAGKEKEVKCHVYKIPGLSGHADQNGLVKWIESFKEKPEAIYLVHGDEEEKKIFCNYLREKGLDCSRSNFNYYILKHEKFAEYFIPIMAFETFKSLYYNNGMRENAVMIYD